MLAQRAIPHHLNKGILDTEILFLIPEITSLKHLPCLNKLFPSKLRVEGLISASATLF